MTRVIDQRVQRLETGYRNGLYINRWRYHDRDHQFELTLPLEVPLPDGGEWRGVNYGLIIAETFNEQMRRLKKPLIRCVTK